MARASAGPRGVDTLSREDLQAWDQLVANRDGYANLILLCGYHHDMVDGDPARYTIASLVQMKRRHEAEMDRRRPPRRRAKDHEEIRYAAIVDHWAQAIDIDRWDAHISDVVVNGWIEEPYLAELERLRFWLLNRVWPRTLGALEEAFMNFRLVEQDLNRVISRYAARRDGLVIVDRVFEDEYVSSRHREYLATRSEWYQDMAADLAVELTRAVNLVCERVRQSLWPDYRLDQGHATVGLGFTETLAFATLRPLYSPDSGSLPYRGLAAFADDRLSRDYYRGEGEAPDGLSGV